MASNPPALWATPSDTPSALNLTPRLSLLDIQTYQTLNKASQVHSGLHVSLKRVLGTTATSPAGFDYSPNGSSYATCAGSVAVVSRISENLEITQTFFRATSKFLPGGSVSSLHNSPDSSRLSKRRSPRLGSSKSRRYGGRPSLSTFLDQEISPSKVNARARTRTASCVALSKDGRLLAVGETGYSPRILIFSTVSDNHYAVPLACLTEHALGVRCLAFSQDSHWLASIGGIHDNFAFLWAINPRNGSAKLHSSNKCTSFVHDLAWMGDSVISVGTRHVRVWRVEDASAPVSPSKSKFRHGVVEARVPASPGSRAFFGRNCLLGSLIDATFTCVASLSNSKAIICTDDGAVCLLDDTDRMQKIYQVGRHDSGIRCLVLDPEAGRLWLGRNDAEVKSISINGLSLEEGFSVGNSQLASNVKGDTSVSSTAPVGCTAIGYTAGHIIIVTQSHHTALRKSVDNSLEPATNTLVKELPAHSSAVLGVDTLPQPNVYESDFFTWSADCMVFFWSKKGLRMLALELPLGQAYLDHDQEPNELRVVKGSPKGDYLVAGDSSGNLRLFIGLTWSDLYCIKAHLGEVNAISITDNGLSQIVASGGRDHTVQIFWKQSSELALLQTIDQHTSSVNQVQFVAGSNTLLSLSTDRTIVVHKLADSKDSMAFIPARIITLKAAPTSMTMLCEASSILVVSTLDRQIHKYDINSGQQLHSMRLLDNETNDSVLLNSIKTQNVQTTAGAVAILVGVSPIDKSVRVHSLETGMTISKDFGHSEGISDIAILPGKGKERGSEYSLVSTAFDSTTMIWSLKQSTNNVVDVSDLAIPHDRSPATSQPLRHILSRSKLSEFKRSFGADDSLPMAVTPTKHSSPTRLRKQLSTASLGRASKSVITPSAYPGRGDSLPGSPSPQRPRSQITERSKPDLSDRHRTKSASHSNDLDMSSEQLCKSLRSWRKKLSSTEEAVRRETMTDLEREMHLTLRAISQKTRRHQAPSETVVGDLLDQYSDRLAQMVEEKVAISMVKQRKDLECPGDAVSTNEPDATTEQAGMG